MIRINENIYTTYIYIQHFYLLKLVLEVQMLHIPSYHSTSNVYILNTCICSYKAFKSLYVVLKERKHVVLHLTETISYNGNNVLEKVCILFSFEFNKPENKFLYKKVVWKMSY